MSTPTITVRTADDVQSAATTRFLDRAGVDYTVVPAEVLTVSVSHVHASGAEHRWHGFQPDRLARTVADLPPSGW